MNTSSWEKARAVPFSLAPGAEVTIPCDADRLYLNSGANTLGALMVRLDDTGAEIAITTGFYARVWRFRRLRLRNAGPIALAGLLLLSADPDFFVIHPSGSAEIGLELRDESARFYPFSAALPSAGNAGSTTTLRHPVLEMDTGTGASLSKTRQAVEDFNAQQMWNTGGSTFWAQRHRVRARMRVYTALGQQDPNTQAGIQLGLAALHPLGVGQSLVRLCASFDSFLPSVVWKLQTSNGAAQSSVDLVGVPAPVVGTAALLEIDLIGGTRADAYINGVPGASLTLTLPSGAQNRGAGIFVGEDATAGARTAAAFTNLEAYTYV